jgi:hypothetical protein
VGQMRFSTWTSPRSSAKHPTPFVLSLGLVLVLLGLKGGFSTDLENPNLLEDYLEDLIDSSEF